MTECKCEEHRAPKADRRWRIKKQKPKGRDLTFQLVCLSCGWEWWSVAQDADQWPRLSEDEKILLAWPSGG